MIDGQRNIVTRDICEQLRTMDVESKPFWKPVHLQQPYIDAEKSDLSVTERIWNYILTLPCSTGITDEELEITVQAVREAILEVCHYYMNM